MMFITALIIQSVIAQKIVEVSNNLTFFNVDTGDQEDSFQMFNFKYMQNVSHLLVIITYFRTRNM